MTAPTPARTFSCGERVLHPKRPQWGRGTVRAARGILHQGARAQRLEVEFANHGRVTLNTAVAPLKLYDDPSSNSPNRTTDRPTAPSTGETSPMRSLSSSSTKTSEGSSGGGWLGSISGNNDQSHELWDLPDALKDPFATHAQRLKATLETYRFSTEPRALIEWAMGQTGLDDPLSKYTRSEMEQAFPRFARDRDQHLRDLIRDMKRHGEREELRLIANKTQLPAARSALDKAIRH